MNNYYGHLNWGYGKFIEDIDGDHLRTPWVAHIILIIESFYIF